ncbi:hypothetical protein G6F22_020996 [Rhizopus arrhizus]|nr:hypothetical protein G6F22_020996 [Rhizopus arrhizus]KAG1387035.1 hypothetical protein G6F59_016585 [Rhizopus arrhizus]
MPRTPGASPARSNLSTAPRQAIPDECNPRNAADGTGAGRETRNCRCHIPGSPGCARPAIPSASRAPARQLQNRTGPYPAR